MEKKYLSTLEFPKILDRLAAYTSFAPSRELALSLHPAITVEDVRQRLQETREARHLLNLKPDLSIGGARDLRAILHHASIGATLDASDLLDVLATLQSGRNLCRTVGKLPEVPLLAAIAHRWRECPMVEHGISSAINDHGEVMDSASPALARLRGELRVAHDRLMARLNELLQMAASAGLLQDPIITMRGDRYVFPVRAEMKNHFRGIVHDQSASGATLFMEPLATVELNNHWRSLQLEEQQEIQRILRHLTSLVAAQADVLRDNLQVLAELDLALAKAKYANDIGATEPMIIGSDHSETTVAAPGPLRLMRARHPLLHGTVVPIDVWLGKDFLVLVITGPNTGGKTVALKTVGLLCLMAQAGLHIPAGEESTLPVFRGIYADIGDEQSIEQSLSTFSSHLTTIIDILQRADEHSLVLLDELGAGTDPVEGSALALAILQHLLERRIPTMVATHYAELKAYAYITPLVQNASVDFDVETLSPTYHLTIGLPGRSNALAIAARLGLGQAIIERARQFLSSAQVQVEALLAQVQQEYAQARQAREMAEAAHQEAARHIQELARQRRALEAERAQILAEIRAQAEAALADVQARLRRLMAQAEDASARAQVADTLREARHMAAAIPEMFPIVPSQEPVPTEVTAPFMVGDTVMVRSLGLIGEIIAISGNEADVQMGSFKSHLPLSDLERRERKESGRGLLPTTIHVDAAGAGAPPLQIDLRGHRAADIISILDRYLNDAYLAGLPFVRIIHGKGTGVLRRAVHEHLRNHPLVTTFQPAKSEDGGDGVTIATLAT